jgi:hypothetical protein
MFLHHPIILSKAISALAIEADECGGRQCGPIGQLSTGARLMPVGDGFNERTVKVQCHGRFYFVFLQDIGGLDSSYHLD